MFVASRLTGGLTASLGVKTSQLIGSLLEIFHYAHIIDLGEF